MSITIQWLGQAGYIVKTERASIAIDPFCGEAKNFAERLYPPFIEKGSIHVDLVLTTHAHWDHFDPLTYREYVIPNAIVGPGCCMRALEESGLSIEGIALNRGQSLEYGGFQIKAVPADHEADSVGYVIDVEDTRLYFSGDTLFSMAAIMPNIDIKPDISFVCINGKLGNMNYREAAVYCNILRTKVAVPTHYDMIRYNNENPEAFVYAVSQMAPEVRPFVMERERIYDVGEILS